MEIELFIAQSEGVWKSMRSSHSLAFQQFEQILSEIKIESINIDSTEMKNFIERNKEIDKNKIVSPFKIHWEAESDWEQDNNDAISSGTSLLIPIKISSKNGLILRTLGYAEPIQAFSNYYFLEDGTFVLKTEYNQTIAEEKIWFVSKNVRCRSSLLKSSKNQGILQTSFASEVRKLNLNKKK